MAKRRMEGVRLLQTGEMTQVQIARHLGVSEAAVSKWRKKLEEDGPQALELHKATGRPPKLNKDEKQRLVELLIKGPIAAGFRPEIWNHYFVNKLIQQEFWVLYNHNYIYNLLDELDMRIPRPGPGGIIYGEYYSTRTGKFIIIDYRQRLTNRHRK